MAQQAAPRQSSFFKGDTFRLYRNVRKLQSWERRKRLRCICCGLPCNERCLTLLKTRNILHAPTFLDCAQPLRLSVPLLISQSGGRQQQHLAVVGIIHKYLPKQPFKPAFL